MRSHNSKKGSLLLALAIPLALHCVPVGSDEGVSGENEAGLFDPYVDEVQESASGDKALSGGRAERGYAPVGFIKFGNGSYCSGTLITDKIAITAAHCVRDVIRGRIPGEVTFNLGSSVEEAQITRTVERIRVHPKYPIDKTDTKVAEYDVALLWVTEPIAKVALAAPSFELASDIGSSGGKTPDEAAADSVATGDAVDDKCDYRYIGFGSSGKNFSAGRRSMGVCLRERSGTYLYYEGMDGFTCAGDSGGAIVRNKTLKLVAIHNGGNCGKSNQSTAYPLQADPQFLSGIRSSAAF